MVSASLLAPQPDVKQHESSEHIFVAVHKLVMRLPAPVVGEAANFSMLPVLTSCRHALLSSQASDMYTTGATNQSQGTDAR